MSGITDYDVGVRRRSYAIGTPILLLFVAMSVWIPQLNLPDRVNIAAPAPKLARISLAPLPVAPKVLPKPKPVVTPPPERLVAKSKPKPAKQKPKPRPVATPPKPALTARRPEPARAVAPVPEPVDVAAQALAQVADAFAAFDVAPVTDTSRIAVAATRVSEVVTTAGENGQQQVSGRDVSALLSAGSSWQNSSVELSSRNESIGARVSAGIPELAFSDPEIGARFDAGGSSTLGGDQTSGARSSDEIRRVFDANKGALFLLYQRALRAQPGLAGELLVELAIAPSGQVRDVALVQSSLGDANLTQALLAKIRGFSFEPRDVAETRVRYPVHFLPG